MGPGVSRLLPTPHGIAALVVLALMALSLVARVVQARVGAPRRSPATSGHVVEDSEHARPNNSNAPLVPWAIFSELRGIKLAPRWQTEPQIEFAIVVKNATGHQVDITGVVGTILCLGVACTNPPILRRERVRLPTEDSIFNCEIKQPVSLATAETIQKHLAQGPHETVGFDLGGLRWNCRVGEVEFEAYLRVGDATVRGPVYSEEEARGVKRFQTAYGRRNYWQDDGQPKGQSELNQ